MVIYNVTTNVSWDVHDSWLRWLKEEQAVAILSTGCFYEYRLLRLLGIDDTEGPTYAIQYHAARESDYQNFLANHSSFITQQASAKWGDKILTFGSLMEVLQ